MPICKIGKSRGCEFDMYYEIHSSGNNNNNHINGEKDNKNYKRDNGKDKVVLVMGFLTQGILWYKNLEEFTKDENYEYLIFDNRGVGRTGNPTTSYSSSAMAMDLLDLMDHLQWENAHVVGVSMGGMISLELAHLAPQRIKSLALVVTHAGSLAPARGIWGITQTIFIRDHRKRALVLAGILYSKPYLTQQSKTDPSRTNLDMFVEKYLKDMETAKPPSISALYGHIRTVNTHKVSKKRLLEIKERIGGPITIITGTHDDLVDPTGSHYLNSILSPIEFVIFNGSGHSVNIENYQEFHDAISRNFKRVESINTINPSKQE
ncbi:hypothetical protein RB653_009366 [Dictyostelium firmibasis]|uniref:AB hydrolase-1 domain-containing protein n=1 Tax=Dictyostelium firmibasis TaxID=79012 RepID=A0AAN7YV65_9MYCE